MTPSVFSPLQTLLDRIHAACLSAKRDPHEVQLVMVSKTVPAEHLSAILDNPYGQYVLGENKAQELKAKAEYFDALPEAKAPLQTPQWHFIGYLQSNKIKDMLPYTCLLHSLDRWSLAQKLQNKLQQMDQTLPVLLQVNAAREDTKSGVMPEEALEFLERVNTLDRLSVQGFMTIGAHSVHEETVRDSFKRLAQIRAQARELGSLAPQNQTLPHLSMGMSGDFEWAIAEGATLVRVGSAIFGAR
jgi:PLP dependent protein